MEAITDPQSSSPVIDGMPNRSHTLEVALFINKM